MGRRQGLIPTEEHLAMASASPDCHLFSSWTSDCLLADCTRAIRKCDNFDFSVHTGATEHKCLICFEANRALFQSEVRPPPPPQRTKTTFLSLLAGESISPAQPLVDIFEHLAAIGRLSEQVLPSGQKNEGALVTQRPLFFDIQIKLGTDSLWG